MNTNELQRRLQQLGAPDTDALRRDPRAKISVVPVLELRGVSEGSYGWGGNEERPAGNPAANANWKFLLNPAIEHKLAGRTAFITENERGSYHERFLDAAVYIITEPKDWDDEAIETHSLSPKEYDHIKKFFKFESIKQTIAIVQQIIEDASSPAKEGESSEQFWNRLVQQFKPAKHPLDTYSHRDDYYRK